MDRDGFSLLVMGFTGKDAMKFKIDFINAFNQMEQNLRALNSTPLEPEELLLKQAQIMIEQKKRMAQIENRVDKIEAKTQTRPDYFTIAGYATLHRRHVTVSMASKLGMAATKICKMRGYPMDTIPDPRFGRVKMYPTSVLENVFKETALF